MCEPSVGMPSVAAPGIYVRPPKLSFAYSEHVNLIGTASLETIVVPCFVERHGLLSWPLVTSVGSGIKTACLTSRIMLLLQANWYARKT